MHAFSSRCQILTCKFISHSLPSRGEYSHMDGTSPDTCSVFPPILTEGNLTQALLESQLGSNKLCRLNKDMMVEIKGKIGKYLSHYNEFEFVIINFHHLIIFTSIKT